MEIENLKQHITNFILEKNIVKITFANFREDKELEKIILSLVEIKKKIFLQVEYRYKRIIKHENITLNSDEVFLKISDFVLLAKDINVKTFSENINIKISKKFKVNINTKKEEAKNISFSHNREKNYLLDKNYPYDFLIKLGIQSKEGRVFKDKYQKFKQINKYLEFIYDAIKKLDTTKKINIVDFGSGKSYLTFSMYYYLKNVLNLDVKITGIDLKKEVIEQCKKIACELSFNDLNFIYGDINDFKTDSNIDMVVSLHACNTATDVALLKALSWEASVILAVPCCQKEVKPQLSDNFLPIILKHGITREKFATLLTDSVRSELLECFGYNSTIMEFISEDNTPKNMLIRAYKNNFKLNKNKFENLSSYLDNLGIKMYLIEEIKKKL